MNTRPLHAIGFVGMILIPWISWAQNKIVVFQSDFGVKDGAVSEMKGVAMGVSADLKLFDLTHEIPAYNIWEAAYRLQQTVPYWPSGTVFVSVVDPGVGTKRKSVVLKTKTGQFIVTPDNGTLTLIAESQGIGEIREIDEALNRRPESRNSFTFHGRDVYTYTAARLAAGIIRFEQVGPLLTTQTVVSIPYQKAVVADGVIKGTIPVLDVQYGNVWTNIPGVLFRSLNLSFGQPLRVRILHKGEMVYQGVMPYASTFGAVEQGKPLAYLNSLLQLSFALNQGDFAAANKIGSGGDWAVEVMAGSGLAEGAAEGVADGSAGGLVEGAATLQLVSRQFSFTEGAAVDREGNIFFTDQPNNKIWEYDLNGRLSLFLDSAGRSNGMYVDSKGRLVTCADEDGQLWAIGPNKKVQVLLRHFGGKQLNGPNDLWIDAAGGIYFTDPYYQRSYWKRTKPDLAGEKVYYLAPGAAQARVAADDVVKPNGIVGTPDGRILYVADIGAGKTYKYKIGANGKLSGRELFVGQGSDGMTLDERGDVYLTGDGVTVYDSSGKQIAQIPVPEKWTANLCFGGKDKKTLLITASTAIYILRMRVRGVE